MKTFSFPVRLLALALATALPAGAATIIQTDNANTNIPDGSSSGLARLINVAGGAESVVSVEVSLQIEAAPGEDAFLGDLYVYLTNGTDVAVLLNRAGRTSTAPAGYGDNQSMDVTFSTTATDNIHNYRLVLNGNAATALAGPLTGNWLADGRATDPAAVLDTDAVTAGLDVFAGAAATGDWGLYIADLSGGGEHRLVSWSLTLETVPEPSALLLSFAAVPLLVRRRR